MHTEALLYVMRISDKSNVLYSSWIRTEINAHYYVFIVWTECLCLLNIKILFILILKIIHCLVNSSIPCVTNTWPYLPRYSVTDQAVLTYVTSSVYVYHKLWSCVANGSWLNTHVHSIHKQHPSNDSWNCYTDRLS